MKGLLIFCAVLLFLLFLLWIPVRLDIGFREEFSLVARYAFLKFSLLPGKEGPEKEKQKKEKKPEKEKEEKKEEKGSGNKFKEILGRTGFFGFLESLFELVGMALSTTKKILSKLRLKRFDLYLCIGGAEDAGAAAILYGQLSGAVYSAGEVLCELMKCRKKAVSLDLDYSSPDNTVDFSARLSIRPLYVVKEGLSLLIKGFPILKKLLGIGVRAKKPKERIPQLREQGEGNE